MIYSYHVSNLKSPIRTIYTVSDLIYAILAYSVLIRPIVGYVACPPILHLNSFQTILMTM